MCDRYYSIRVHHIETHSQSHTFVQPPANPVDSVLTAFNWISAYYTVLASRLEAVFGRVASHGVSLLPVSDTEELSVRANAVPSNTNERIVYKKCELYKYCTLKCAIRY